MKKLLSLSILAATLASTAAFAAPQVDVASAADNNASTQLVISQKASPTIVDLFRTAQAFNNSITNGNHAKTIVVDLDDQGHFSKATVNLAQALAGQDHDAIVTALMSSARTTNHNLGWKAVQVVAGNGPTLATVYAIDSVKNSNNVHAYVIHNERNEVTITEVKAAQDVAANLTSAKRNASLTAVAVQQAN